MARRLLITFACTLLLGGSTGVASAEERGAPTLVEAARAWLTTLPPTQRAKAQLAFEDRERRVWHYVPRARRGLSLREMSESSRRAARSLAALGLGARGWAKAQAVFRLEAVLREQAVRANPRSASSWRDPLLYFVTVFGDPSDANLWGLRIEGHHLSANLTCRGSTVLQATPFFLGASPAHVRLQGGETIRPLAAQEDLALRLVRALDAGQRRMAVAGLRPLGDVLNGPARRPTPTGQGLEASAMTAAQREMLEALVRSWLELGPPDPARTDGAALGSVAGLRFLWMGSMADTGDRYYRIEGPRFLLELRNLGNHVHMVRRDPRGDFGRAAGR